MQPLSIEFYQGHSNGPSDRLRFVQENVSLSHSMETWPGSGEQLMANDWRKGQWRWRGRRTGWLKGFHKLMLCKNENINSKQWNGSTNIIFFMRTCLWAPATFWIFHSTPLWRFTHRRNLPTFCLQWRHWHSLEMAIINFQKKNSSWWSWEIS